MSSKRLDEEDLAALEEEDGDYFPGDSDFLRKRGPRESLGTPAIRHNLPASASSSAPPPRPRPPAPTATPVPVPVPRGSQNPRGSYSKAVREWGATAETPGGAVPAASLTPPSRRNVSGYAKRSAEPAASSFQPPSRVPSGIPSLMKPPSNMPSRRHLTRLPSGVPITTPRSAASSSSLPQPPPPRRGASRAPSRAPSALRGGKRGASTIVGNKKTVRLSIVPSARPAPSQRQLPARAVSFAPKRLLDIENGKSMVVSDQQFLPGNRYQEIGQDGALVVTARATAPIAKEDAAFFEDRGTSLQDKIAKGDVRDFESNSEVGLLGGAWRGTLRRLMMWSFDDINALRLSRNLQLFLPFLTGYEAYIVGQLVEALESGRKSDVRYVLSVAFRNRNVSRVLVQTVGPRYDFLWHWYTAISWNRFFDAWGQLPLIGITAFPASENFPATRDHALASIFRVLLGEGNWMTRVVTQGREGLVTDNPKNTAQNLAAESNGFELANRNQYGTYVGRRRTNEFRFSHRLPTDESIVRSFVNSPMPPMLNNGVVHQIRQLAKHWHNMLYQFSGNFAHQRMEQLDPFETLRFHMPVTLLTLSTLRGRNKWDSKVLGPYIRKLQELKPSFTAETAKYLVRECQENIALNVCAGVASILDPFHSWLEAIGQACEQIEEEAKQIYEIVTSVEIGIRLGHDLITQVSWKIPSDSALKKAILNHIRGLSTGEVNERRIRSAMNLVTPRDKRTLIELVKTGLGNSKPAQLLLGRCKTLLQRELRREILNEAIRDLSKGDCVDKVEHDEWYWIEEGDKSAVYVYDAKVTGRDQHRFLHVDTKFDKFVSLGDGSVKVRAYVPVAEAISRAQRAFMTIELDHGKKFAYNAFMEFTYLRKALRQLVVLSQVHCEELDNARLNVLQEIQRSFSTQVSVHDLEVGKTYYTYDAQKKSYETFTCGKQYTAADPEWTTLARSKIVKCPPQSMIVIGGGPTGLMTVVHCTEAVLVSGGVMKLYEARDAFTKGGATFERAQIVRLDSRWIGMLRYHLGTGFEDVYIPASGETDSQLGNTLPTQGFVEITIKDLENMLHVEVSKMWSKGLISVSTDSRSKYDNATNSLTKMGEHLKLDDGILRRVDEEGNRDTQHHSWKVVDLVYQQPLGVDELQIGAEYGVYVRLENAVMPHKLMGIDLETQTYTFKPLQEEKESIKANASNMPSVYPKGTTKHADVSKVIVESVKKGKAGGYVRHELMMKTIKKEKFTMDIGHTHVVECIGKPHGSKVHFSVTTYEPYGVCCIQGLKISMGMHNFGEKRWGSGLVDDIRSHTDQNTRVVGDFTKMVRQAPVCSKMLDYMSDSKDTNWQTHFNMLVEKSEFPELNDIDPVVPKIREACRDLASRAPGFRRATLQTRFFETGDNYYLGMEFTREYDRWKNALGAELVAPLSLKVKDDATKKKVGKFKGLLMHHIDRLWYDGCLETIRTGDVYNPGARYRVPRLHLINSYTDQKLGALPVGESFRLSDRAEEKYEIVIKKGSGIIVRNVEGYISKMPRSTTVKREGNLTRGPDGNAESKVSLATFPVGHYVNFRTMRLNDSEKGYTFAFIGDEQSTPHFMRYSGLTGACINAMLFNNFVKAAIDGEPFIDRFRLYSVETNWSNGEVVQRGTGANYGMDGFLRPGFAYGHGLDYLHSKVIEYRESDQDLDTILSRDWLVKMAAALVPRGMELNEDFIRTLYNQLQTHVFEKLIREVEGDKKIASDALVSALRSRYAGLEQERAVLDYNEFWDRFMSELEVGSDVKRVLEDPHVFIVRRMDQMCNQIIEHATKAYLYNDRVSSELFNQPKPVDSIIDDFAVEAQGFANSFVQSAAFSAGALAFSLIGTTAGNVFSGIVAAFNILISFGTMTNVSRYKIRNEEARVIFQDEKMLQTLKAVFSLMSPKDRESYSSVQNPFVEHLDRQVEEFLRNAEYYDYEEPKEFKEAYSALKENLNDPTKIQEFQTLLTTKFVADTYHVSSYVQESLVNIYKTSDETYHLLNRDINRTVSSAAARELFDRIVRFRTRLETTLQRGPTRWGFVKQRKFSQWDIVACFKYFWSLMCFSSAKRSIPCAPISTETYGILRQTRGLSALHHSTILRREIRDLETLYFATRESDIASLMFMTGLLVFLASVLFTVARIFSIDVLLDVAFWASLPSSFGAILASFHLFRKTFILLRLFFILGGKSRTAESSDDREHIRKVRRVTVTQIELTVARLAAALAAAVALPWSIAENGYGDEIDLDEDLPFWIALGAVGTAVLSTLYFFWVEYYIRYTLDPKLGEYVCESFRGEIENMFKVLSMPINDIDTKQAQERETWEYVAREFLHRYRLDNVFDADRFGAIMQYLQSGMDPRNE